MVKCLESEGVRVAFGYPGAAICPFYDSLRQSEQIMHVLTRTEQNAGHAASGYARMTGRPGVCIATSGPGATNLFTAIATAYSDSIPLVAITGQVPTAQLGRDVFQEVDTTGAAEPFTKYTFLVKDAKEIPRVFKEAFFIASTGRQGPVIIDVPMDIQQSLVDFQYPADVDIRGYKPRFRGHAVQVKRVAAAIREAKRPLLCIGGGVLSAGAQQQVQRLCEQCTLPTVSTMMGIGALPTTHRLNYGMLGQSGSAVANRAVDESDLLILIGARVGDRAMKAPTRLEATTTIVHIDIDAAEIGKNVGVVLPLVGDARAVTEQLIDQNPAGEWHRWIEWLDAQRGQEPVYAYAPGQLNPKVFIRMMTQAMNDDAVIVADVGQNQIWTARNSVIRSGRFLTTGGMGTMGYSLPAAIGAKLACPDRQVVAVCGDGSFQMSMMELATAVQHNVPVKLVVMRNGFLGMVREIQQNSYGDREIAVKIDGSPDICKLAQAYSIASHRLERMEDAQACIDKFLGEPGPAVLECVVDYREATV